MQNILFGCGALIGFLPQDNKIFALLLPHTPPQQRERSKEFSCAHFHLRDFVKKF